MKHKSDEEFLRELLNDFKVEAAEHLQAIVEGLLKLEKRPDAATADKLVETVFREVHSMKGAARAVNLILIEQLCMSMESVFHEVKNKKLELQPFMFDLFYHATDYLQSMVAEIDSTQKTISKKEITWLNADFEQLIQPKAKKKNTSFYKPSILGRTKGDFETDDKTNIPRPPGLEKKSPSPGPQTETPASPPSSETIRVSAEKLGFLLRQAEEMITIKSAISYQLEKLNDKTHNGNKELQNIAHSLNQEKRKLSIAIDELLLAIKKTLLCPFSTLLNVVPRIIRDLSKEYDKDIDYEIEGGETEIDRSILEEMKDPLIHIIRNCIDHGIETRDERLKRKKSATGLVKISIFLDSEQRVVIRISDDGKGIDSNKLVNSAIKTGLIKHSDQKTLSDQEKLMLLFKSGISTSPFITDVSGRGLGMAIVNEKVTKVGGNISVETERCKGSTFTITLPQTMAMFRGLLTETSGQIFLVQTTSVVKVMALKQEDIKTVESKNTFYFNGENLALVNLADVLAIGERHVRQTRASKKLVLIIHVSQKKIAFIADAVLGEHEGIVKKLGSHLKHVRNIAGASLIGDGRLVPVLNLQELVESALHHGKAVDYAPIADEEELDDAPEPILVVEDSITVRNLLKNIIEAAGFRVSTAVDGLEALEKLQNEDFSLVVSDIEMPRMNGFELTTRIRENNKLADIPVVLVTALESAEDRKKGLEAGANAYIRKGSFEKGNLIETINRLI